MKLDLILLRANFFPRPSFIITSTVDAIGKTERNIITYLLAALSNNHFVVLLLGQVIFLLH